MREATPLGSLTGEQGARADLEEGSKVGYMARNGCLAIRPARSGQTVAKQMQPNVGKEIPQPAGKTHCGAVSKEPILDKRVLPSTTVSKLSDDHYECLGPRQRRDDAVGVLSIPISSPEECFVRWKCMCV